MDYIILPLSPDDPVLRKQVVASTGAPSNRQPLVMVVPGAAVTCRWLTLPRSTPAQARAAARLALGEAILDPSEVHLVLGAPDEAGRHRALLVDRRQLEAWLDRAAALGLRPDFATPDYFFAEEPRGEEIVQVDLGDRILLRGHDLECAAEPSLAALIVGERPTRKVAARGVEALLGEQLPKQAVNLLEGEFRPRGRLPDPEASSWRGLGALLGAVLLSLPVLEAARGLHDELAARDLDRQARAAAARISPQAAQASDVAAALQPHLARARGQAWGGAISLAAALSGELAGMEGARLDSLVASPDGSLRATLVLDDISALEQLARGLRRAGVGLTEKGVEQDAAGQVVADVLLMVRA